VADAPSQPVVRERGAEPADDFELWTTLEADSNVEEVVRNFFIRQPLLWVH
jgi:hypothetical protein